MGVLCISYNLDLELKKTTIWTHDDYNGKKKSTNKNLSSVVKRTRKGGRLVRETFLYNNYYSTVKHHRKKLVPTPIGSSEIGVGA